jgi:hypothetical protein
VKAQSQESSKPGLLRGLWAGWRRIAKKIGNFQARILMAIFYFTLFCPFALAVRWGSDPLALKPGDPRGWRTPVAPEGSSLDRARKQFS